jgi:hypothetical protein
MDEPLATHYEDWFAEEFSGKVWIAENYINGAERAKHIAELYDTAKEPASSAIWLKEEKRILGLYEVTKDD